jgi:hypothetical protein
VLASKSLQLALVTWNSPEAELGSLSKQISSDILLEMRKAQCASVSLSPDQVTKSLIEEDKDDIPKKEGSFFTQSNKGSVLNLMSTVKRVKGIVSKVWISWAQVIWLAKGLR